VIDAVTGFAPATGAIGSRRDLPHNGRERFVRASCGIASEWFDEKPEHTDEQAAGTDMTQRLTGRTALVTGGSRGIGRAIAQRLASEGAAVVVTVRSMSPSRSVRDGQEHVLEGILEETVQLIEQAGGHAVPIAADLEDRDQRAGLIDAAVTAVGGLDILVNNAGFADCSSLEKMS
jgi:NADPH:quinone reductase-like Zn-dependent oxidoreductase